MTRSKVLEIVAGVIALAIAGTIGGWVVNLMVSPPKEVDGALADAARVHNKKLPMVTPDGLMRIDGMKVVAPNTVEYRYTLLKMDTAHPDEFQEREREARTTMAGQLCSGTAARRLLDSGVTYIYAFYAADDTFQGSVKVTKADCKGA